MCMMRVYSGKEDLMTTTKVFQNGNSQAIRIPQEMRTEKREYCISKVGEVYIAYPADDPWGPARLVAGTFSEDELAEREQPLWSQVAEREGL